MRKIQKQQHSSKSLRQKMLTAICTTASAALLFVASISVTACTVWWWDEPQMPEHLQAKCNKAIK